MSQAGSAGLKVQDLSVAKLIRCSVMQISMARRTASKKELTAVCNDVLQTIDSKYVRGKGVGCERGRCSCGASVGGEDGLLLMLGGYHAWQNLSWLVAGAVVEMVAVFWLTGWCSFVETCSDGGALLDQHACTCQRTLWVDRHTYIFSLHDRSAGPIKHFSVLPARMGRDSLLS